ncbi:ISAs1 family transposase [Mesosutterella sp. OilRF-GAM-744-9]|uniref:ISAs1 family transposase n=1 Tax=Mesosutterella porci TaxID=2915351 RepID=A0ABS9MRH5_9BURK|nr:ISAs1 family transposase [Mesosutterella sp. oilRF-744-WT-GAM-9]MCG5031221.1 ISAs1 family transposase [Mesosutterella sp. oilRF-744-WT-GAM-9]
MAELTEVLDSLKCAALFFQNLDTPYTVGKREIHPLVHILSGVRNFRNPGKTVYRLENLLAICFVLAMKGELHSFHYAATYVRIKEDEFVALGLIEKGKVPSHDTFRRIFGHLDANALRDAFLERIREFLQRLTGLNHASRGRRKILSGDGKTFNGSGKGGARNLNVFNIYSPSEAVCLPSVPLTDKDSEIKEFQRMLPKYNLRNTIVTADALHCQRETSRIICGKKGGYVFKVKANQEELLAEIASRFERKSGTCSSMSYNECDYEFLPLDKQYIGCGWPGQKTYVKMISHKRKHQKDYSPLPQYFIASESGDRLLAEAIDNRWQIEDGLHLFKDQTLGEDKCTFMDANAVKVMATMNNIVYSIYRIASAVLGDKSMTETKIRFKDDPIALISTVLPLLQKKNLSALIRANMRGRKPVGQPA